MTAIGKMSDTHQHHFYPLKIMDQQKRVLDLLEGIEKFPARSERKCICTPRQKTKPMGFALGSVFAMGQGQLMASRYNTKYAELYEACCKMIEAHNPDFKWNCIQINKNQRCAPHKDTNNEGMSIIIGLGNYTGGWLVVNDVPIKIKDKFVEFDGKQTHYTKPFRGTRYSIIFFTVKPRWLKKV